MRSYYEFFAGGRHGAGWAWARMDLPFANDIDAKKGASYAANWGDEHLKIGMSGPYERKTCPARPISPGPRSLVKICRWQAPGRV